MEAAFDRLAASYDDVWTNSAIGQLQRDAFWLHAGALFQSGDAVLDLGCGTGEDALLLERRGVRVRAIDSSAAMVSVAIGRGVDARLLAVEELNAISPLYDGAFSNFGAMNCVARWSDIREPLARLIRPGGPLAVCVLSRFCLWETLWFSLQGRGRKAFRRWKGDAEFSGRRIYYRTVEEMRRALAPEFTLTATAAIGIAVPPSYVRGLSPALLRCLGRIDRRIASWPGLRALGDHRLLLFRRNPLP